MAVVIGCFVYLFLYGRAQAAPLVGFSDDPHSFVKAASVAGAAHATGARIVTGWRETPADAAAAVDAMTSRGIRPIITLATYGTTPTTHQYARSCEAMARAYPSALIEADNEGNIPLGGSQSVEQVVTSTNACARAVHQVDPDRRVIGPSIAPVDMSVAAPLLGANYLTTENAQWRAYFRAVYSQLIGVEVNLHLYPYGRHPLPRLAAQYRMGARYGRVYVTETAMLGTPAAPHPPGRAARLSAKASALLVGLGARAVMFHRLAQVHGDWTGWRTHAVDLAGQRTPLFRALRGVWR